MSRWCQSGTSQKWVRVLTLPVELFRQNGELVVGGGGGRRVLVERHIERDGFETKSWVSVMEKESAFAFRDG